MTMKEVEQILGISKASIRFYEKEGLLNPKRGENKYREYTNEDVERLKQIIIFRKIGISVEEIRKVLNQTVPLQDVLSDNIVKLETQMEEIRGAIKLCELMRKKQADMCSFDEAYYWDVIHTEERQGNKFFEIVNDIAEFEKRVIFEEFGLADENGKIRFSPLTSVLISIGMCLCVGLMWFFLDEMRVEAFIEGFFFPFVCILVSSVFGLPLHFLEKKYARAAGIIKKIGMGFCVIFVIVVLFLMFFVEV